MAINNLKAYLMPRLSETNFRNSYLSKN